MQLSHTNTCLWGGVTYLHPGGPWLRLAGARKEGVPVSSAQSIAMWSPKHLAQTWRKVHDPGYAHEPVFQDEQIGVNCPVRR